jgi:hypothetical protein
MNLESVEQLNEWFDYRSRTEARELVKKYPWFALGHLYRLSQESDKVTDPEAWRFAGIVLKDPLWMNWKLRNEEKVELESGEEGFLKEEEVLLKPEIEESSEQEEEVGLSASTEDVTPALPEIIQEQGTPEGLVPFEPMHTVDYFASQGIRLSREEQEQDKLGQKMKSFTEWLRSMKKVYPTKVLDQVDQVTQENIQRIAEHSNESGEVWTETMAEVLKAQGKYEKAREVYHKLSLMDSAKSAYFAAKIAELKSF